MNMTEYSNAKRFSTLRQPHSRTSCSQAFTLFETLAVLVIVSLLSVFVVRAVSGVPGAQNVKRSASEMAGLLSQARAYALAQNTYVWVGFFEEDGSRPSATPASVGYGGRIIVSVVASKSGSRYDDSVVNDSAPAAFGANSPSNTVQLVPLCRLYKFNSLRMVDAGESPQRPAVNAAYRLGDASSGPPNNAGGKFALHENASLGNPTTFTYPLGAAVPQYTFSKIIEFNPRGEASKIAENLFSGPGPQPAMEIALQSVPPSPEHPIASALQIEGLTGQVRIFQP